MKEKKNIDRLFQEKFKDFESEPHPRNWDAIASRLDKKDRKRPFVIPLWFKLGGVAAAIAIIISGILFTQNQDLFSNQPGYANEDLETERQKDLKLDSTNSENKFKETDSQLSSKDSIEASGSSESGTNHNSLSKSTYVATEVATENSVTPDSSEKESYTSKNNNVADNNTTKNEVIPQSKSNAENVKLNTEIAENSNSVEEKYSEDRSSKIIDPASQKSNSSENIAAVDHTANNSSEEKNRIIKDSEEVEKEENALSLVEENNKLKEENLEEDEAEAKAKKLRLSTFAAPVFYTNIGGGNELSNQLAGNSSSSEVTLSYGVKVAYDIGKKLKIRTGISKVNMSYNIEDIIYSPTAASTGFDNIDPIEDNLEIRTESSPIGSGAGTQISPAENGFTDNSLASSIFTPGEINQQFGFIEVPVELEYAVIDNKFGLNIIGGASSLFLDANRVDLIAGEARTQLGEASNINNTSFSTNIGLGMDYELSDKFSVSVEPILKYQINTFTDVSNVRPMNFGIYSGLNFKF